MRHYETTAYSNRIHMSNCRSTTKAFAKRNSWSTRICQNGMRISPYWWRRHRKLSSKCWTIRASWKMHYLANVLSTWRIFSNITMAVARISNWTWTFYQRRERMGKQRAVNWWPFWMGWKLIINCWRRRPRRPHRHRRHRKFHNRLMVSESTFYVQLCARFCSQNNGNLLFIVFGIDFVCRWRDWYEWGRLWW